MNLYWPIYKNLEKELITLAEQIHIDDNQLSVYSVKISELLIRTVVEIESISKEIYLKNGGLHLLDDNGSKRNLIFDKDCLKYLEGKWALSKKKVSIAHPFLFFEKQENIALTPLKNASKGSRCDWKVAYQNVKHDRASHLTKGNLKHFMRALAALFILNAYNNDDTRENNTPSQPPTISDIFNGYSIDVYPTNEEIPINDEYIFIQKLKDTDVEKYYKLSNECFKNIMNYLGSFPNVLKKYEENLRKGEKYNNLFHALIEIEGTEFATKIASYDMRYINFITKCEKITVLNKGQIIYPAKTQS